MSQHLDFRWTDRGGVQELEVWCHDHRQWCSVYVAGDERMCARCLMSVEVRLARTPRALRSAYRHR